MTEQTGLQIQDGAGGRSKQSDVAPSVGDAPNKFDLLCDNVNTSMVMLNNTLQEFFGFKDTVLKHALPPKLLVQMTLLASKVFRCFSDLCTPVGELTRLARLHSTPWEEKGEVLKRLRTDYESMQRQLNIALRKIEMMAAEEERIKHERRVKNWEKLFARVMGAKSHGRRWKFRIEPFRRKLKDGFDLYDSDSSDESEDETNRPVSTPEESEDELKDLASDSEGGDSEILSSHSGLHTSSSQKRVRFADMDPPAVRPSPTATPPPAIPPVETCDATTSTEDPHYDNYLLVQVFSPNGISPTDQDLCCTLSLGDQFLATEPFSSKPIPSNILMHQDFHFPLSDDSARTLPPGCEDPSNFTDIPKLNIAVYLRNISGDMAAYTSIPLRELTLTEESTTIIPPDDSGEQFELDWEGMAAGIQAPPAEYQLRIRGDEGTENDMTPLIPLICQRVKVQSHQCMHSGTTTIPWDELLTELGYHQVPDLQSRAVSAIEFEEVMETPQEEVQSEEVEQHISAEEMAGVMLKHTEEMKKLQRQYEHRLEALSRTLANVKADKASEISQLEQALIEAEKNKGRKGHSSTEIRQLLARKRKVATVTHGLPKWGEDFPEDFFERLEMFAEESVRKHAELTERIKKEVSEACEKQLATQHRLAPGLPTNTDTATEDVSLPALFMPTVSSKSHVYTPRAHGYFHPPGSTDTRVTQPPAVFKLPALHRTHLPTLNLFDLSQQFAQMGPQWLKEHHYQSPRYTPAPPPSACGFYRQDLTTTAHHTQ